MHISHRCNSSLWENSDKFIEQDIDIITLSGHKVGAGLGVGVLAHKRSVAVTPMMVGGGQERGFRSGTENVAAISALGVVADEIKSNLIFMDKVRFLRNLFESKIKALYPEIIICSEVTNRLPNTSCIIHPRINGEIMLMYFDMRNISFSLGSACSSGKTEVSHVLLAMGINEDLARCSIRISMGYRNNEDEIYSLIKQWENIENLL